MRRPTPLPALLVLLAGLAPGPSTPALADGPAAPSADSPLARRLLPLIRAHKGKVSVAVKHLATGESFRHEDDRPMPTASLIKFPVMVEAYRQSEAGLVDLGSTVTLRAADKVPGSGVLTSHFSDGATYPLRDAVRMMIAFSDNTATNQVLDAIGLGATAATMEKLGYPNTKIHSKVFRRDTSVFPERSKQFGLGSTTAGEMVRLFEELHHRRLAGAGACEAMLGHLRACDDRDKFPRFLPPGAKLAFKTGSVSDARTAAGLLECEAGTVAICVLSSENEDTRWVPDNAGNRLCAEVAREVFEHFKKPAPAPAVADPGGRPAAPKPAAPAAGTGGR